MLIDVVLVITAGALGLALGAATPMLGAAVALGRTVKVVIGADVGDGAVVAPAVLGFADADALGRTDALARGDAEGDAPAGQRPARRRASAAHQRDRCSEARG